MSSDVPPKSDLPPKREAPALRPVEKPLAGTRLNRLIYLLILLSTLLSAYYSWRVVQWKTEVGGWWNLAVGKRPPQLKHAAYEGPGGGGGQRKKHSGGGDTVEDRINALADALGMPSRDLAAAIAGAVKHHVPPASLSSVAAHQTGEAVQVLLKDAEESDGKNAKMEGEQEGGGVVDGIASGMGSFVGMDEP